MAMATLEDILRDRIKELENELKPYKDTGLTPDEAIKLKTNFEQLLKMYEAGCAGYVGLWNELTEYHEAEEQGLLHKAPVPDGTMIYILNDDDSEFFGDDFEPILETSYLHGYTEFVYGEQGKGWFLSIDAAEEALKGGVAE